MPDATTVWLFRARLMKAKAIDKLFARFDAALTDRGYLAMGGQIIYATVANVTLAWLRTHGQASLQPATMMIALLDWLHCDGHIVEGVADTITICCCRLIGHTEGTPNLYFTRTSCNRRYRCPTPSKGKLSCPAQSRR